VLATKPSPTDTPYEGKDHSDQDAGSERVIMILNEFVAEVDGDVEIERENSYSDQG